MLVAFGDLERRLARFGRARAKEHVTDGFGVLELRLLLSGGGVLGRRDAALAGRRERVVGGRIGDQLGVIAQKLDQVKAIPHARVMHPIVDVAGLELTPDVERALVDAVACALEHVFDEVLVAELSGQVERALAVLVALVEQALLVHVARQRMLLGVVGAAHRCVVVLLGHAQQERVVEFAERFDARRRKAFGHLLLLVAAAARVAHHVALSACHAALTHTHAQPLTRTLLFFCCCFSTARDIFQCAVIIVLVVVVICFLLRYIIATFAISCNTQTHTHTHTLFISVRVRVTRQFRLSV